MIQIPRIARTLSQSCYYHIIIQGINKEFIFKKESYIKEFLEIVMKKLEGSNITILSYCIMSNHAHFLIYSENPTYLSKYMQRVNTSYSQFYNKINNRVGYVFRDRYLSQDITSNKQLYNCLNYIHNNPVKANIVKNMEDYKYSSYIEFINKDKRKVITEESIKLIFGSAVNFKEQFYYVHKQKYSPEGFIEIKEKTIDEIIYIIENKYGNKIDILKENREILEEFIKAAREETDIKIVQLAELLDISKTKVWNYGKNRMKK